MENLINLDLNVRYLFSAAIFVAGVFLLFIVFRTIWKHTKALAIHANRKAIFVKAFLPTLLFISTIILKINAPFLIHDKEIVSLLLHILTIIIVVTGAWILINAIRITRIIILSRYDVTQKNNLVARKMHTQLKIIERVLVFILVFIALSLALMTFESIRKVGISLFASAGIAGIILGFAAQKVLGSILAGVQIAITQPIRIDDVVIFEGEWGWIEEITLTYVVIRLWDRRRLIVPTSTVIETPFQNWTRSSSDILGSVFIFADYTMPIDPIRDAFNEILSTCNLWDGDISNVQVTNATNTALEIRLLMSASDSPTLWDLRVHVREKIVEYLQKNYPDKLPKTRVYVNQPNDFNSDN